jgi:hypothetical protein
MGIKTGDTIVTNNGKYLIVSTDDFNLFDDDNERFECILIDVERGSMEGYYFSITEIKKAHNIIENHPNCNSYERVSTLQSYFDEYAD